MENSIENNKLKISQAKVVAYLKMISNSSNVCIIIIHGLAEHKGRYVEFINKLNSLQYSVFALDLLGHGESSGTRGDIIKFADYIDELKEFVYHIKQKYPQMKICLFGHSLGGLIASLYVSMYNDVDFLVLSNPLLERKEILNIFYLIPYKHLGFIKIKKRHSESKEMLEYSRRDPLSCKFMTIRMLGEIFIDGINTNRKRTPLIKIPLLILGGNEDNLTNSYNLSNIIQNFGSKDKTLKMYSGVKHRLVHSTKKDEVINDISNWIKKRMQ